MLRLYCARFILKFILWPFLLLVFGDSLGVEKHQENKMPKNCGRETYTEDLWHLQKVELVLIAIELLQIGSIFILALLGHMTTQIGLLLCLQKVRKAALAERSHHSPFCSHLSALERNKDWKNPVQEEWPGRWCSAMATLFKVISLWLILLQVGAHMTKCSTVQKVPSTPTTPCQRDMLQSKLLPNTETSMIVSYLPTLSTPNNLLWCLHHLKILLEKKEKTMQLGGTNWVL